MLTQIKPFLYYLASKDVNREGDGYIFGTDLFVGFFWEYKKSNDEYKNIRIGVFNIDNIRSGLNFVSFIPYDDVDYRELENPFEIYIEVVQEYVLLRVNEFESVNGLESVNELESEDELEWEDELEEDKAPVAVSKPFHSDQCVVCLLEKPELLFINCLHRCVCLKCEEKSPLRICPSCRTDISIKVKI